MAQSAFESVINFQGKKKQSIKIGQMVISNMEYEILEHLEKTKIKSDDMAIRENFTIVGQSGDDIENRHLAPHFQLINTNDPEKYDKLKHSVQFIFYKDNERYQQYSKQAKDCSIKTYKELFELAQYFNTKYTEKYNPARIIKGKYKDRNIDITKFLFLHQDHMVVMQLTYAIDIASYIVNCLIYYVPYSSKPFLKQLCSNHDITEWIEGSEKYDNDRLLEVINETRKMTVAKSRSPKSQKSPRSSSPMAKSRTPRSSRSPSSPRSKSSSRRSASPIATPAYEDYLYKLSYPNMQFVAPVLPAKR